MTYFDAPDFDAHEAVHMFCDKESGLKAIVALHDTTLGPGLGGLRMWPYENDSDAMDDVLRLSKGMSYKNALAGLNFGGGKAVIIGDAKTQKTPALIHAMANAIHSLGGRYYTGEDVGMTVADMDAIQRVTPYVRGTGDKGDPSPATAKGVFLSIQAAAKHTFGTPDLAGRRVTVQGLGNVGMRLAKLLHDAGAQLVVADVNDAAVQSAVARFDASAVSVDAIAATPADIFAPCALGAVLNEQSIADLQVRCVVGAANNQLAVAEDANRLAKRDIVYVPDYLANAGGCCIHRACG